MTSNGGGGFKPNNNPLFPKTIIAGDWEKAWDIFETKFPVETGDFPPLEQLLAWDPDEEEKTARRQRERTIQEEYARARVQRIDAFGRAHAVGKRKTSVARVWIKPGTGEIWFSFMCV